MSEENGTTDNAVICIRGLSRALRDMYSAYCRRRGSDMTTDIRRYMKKCVAEDREVIFRKMKNKKAKKVKIRPIKNKDGE
jgi:hypothetical protein